MPDKAKSRNDFADHLILGLSVRNLQVSGAGSQQELHSAEQAPPVELNADRQIRQG